MELIDGKLISQQIKDEVKAETEELCRLGKRPCLAVILVGNDPASSVYVNNKKKGCEYCGFDSISIELPEETSEQELLLRIQELNDDPQVNGILVQLPLPRHINEDAVIAAIKPEKDVDGFHPVNVGNLLIGRPGMVSCTPAGIIELLKRSQVEMSGKKCVVIGRSNIVGKPMAVLMLRENATVTICHSRSVDVPAVCREADIVIAAVGKPKMITEEYIKEGAVVIDVGIHRMENKKLCGDVDFDAVADKCSKITPVPGGVGPMTIAMLMKNCLEAFKRQNG